MNAAVTSKDFFPGFAWVMPVAFSDTLSRCRFERGDLLYDSPKGYQKWEEAIKCLHYSIQVKLPAQGVGRATDQAGVFEENWRSEVVFTVTDYRTKESHEVKTTQGRLFMLLWKGDWEILNAQAEPPVPLTCFALLRRCENVASEVKKHVLNSHRIAKPNFFVMAYDPTHYVSRTKYEAVKKRLDREFKVVEHMFSPAELGLRNLEIVPTVQFAAFAIDLGEPSLIFEALKEVLYKPLPKKKTEQPQTPDGNGETPKDRFKLSTHGAFIPYREFEFQTSPEDELQQV